MRPPTTTLENSATPTVPHLPPSSLHSSTTGPLGTKVERVVYEVDKVKLVKVGKESGWKRWEEQVGPVTDQLQYLISDLNNEYLGIVTNSQTQLHKLSTNLPPFIVHFNHSDPIPTEKTPLVNQLATLIPPTPNTQPWPPGLVTCSQLGLIQYWPNLHQATITPNSFYPPQTYQLPLSLEVNESVQLLIHCQSQGIVVGTSHSLHYFELKQDQLIHHPLTRTTSFLSQFTSFLRRTVTGLEGLQALCYTPNDNGQLYALTTTHLFSWSLSTNFPPQFESESDLTTLIPTILNGSMSNGEVQFLKLVTTPIGKVAILVQVTESMSDPIHYGLLILEGPPSPSQPEFISLHHPGDRGNEPILSLTFTVDSHDPQDGAFVLQFTRALIVVPLNPNHRQVLIPLRMDKFGHLVEVRDIHTDTTLAGCMATGLFQIQYSSQPSEDPLYQPTTTPFKSQFIQAIALEDTPVPNPVSFRRILKDFPRTSDLLDILVKELVDDIVTLQFPDSRSSLDIQRQLQNRHTRLKALAGILNDSELMEQVTMDIRYYLASAAQKITAATSLYLHYSHRIRENEIGVTSHLLSASLQALYQTTPIQDDPYQHFFNYDIQRVPDLLRIVANQSEPHGDSEPRSQFIQHLNLFESNLILLKTLQTVLNFTYKYSSWYHLDDSPSSEPWTEDGMILGVLQACFQRTVYAIGSLKVSSDFMTDDAWVRATELEEVASHPRLLAMGLKRQLGGLSENLLRIAHAQVTWARKLRPSLVNQRTLELDHLSDTIYSTLGSVHLRKEAMLLAEQHRDFRSLSRLLINSPDPSLRAKELADEHGSPFIQAFLEGYIQADRPAEIFQWADVWPDHLSQVLAHPRHDSFGWLYELKTQNFSAAHQKLLSQTSHQAIITHRKTLLSLSKLAQFATVKELPSDCQTVPLLNSAIEEIDDQLDVLSAHEQLQQYFGCLTSPEDTVTAETLVARILPEGMRSSRSIQTKLARESIQTLLDGRILPFECLIDLLTLKGNSANDLDESAANGFELALEVVRRKDSRVSELAVDYALRTIWRRVLLYDSWDQIDQDGRKYGDQHLLARFQETALYGLILAALDNNTPNTLILPPSACLFTTPHDHLVHRYPSLPHLAIHHLCQDFARENATLEQYRASHRLDLYYNEICTQAMAEYHQLHPVEP